MDKSKDRLGVAFIQDRRLRADVLFHPCAIDDPRGRAAVRASAHDPWSAQHRNSGRNGETRFNSPRTIMRPVVPEISQKKSRLPKLPDFSASRIGGVPSVAVQGTPGSICGPIFRAATPSACTTAPAVSPPATNQPRHAAPDQALRDACQRPLDHGAASATPSSACTDLTDSGVAVA